MKVLLVMRDSQQLRNLVEVFLEYDENLMLETADSAFFALTRLERDTPDLIISAADVGMSGAEFLEILRADAFLEEIPFVLLDETALATSVPGASEIILGAHASPALILGAAASLLARKTDAEAGDSHELASGQPGTPVLQGTTALVSPFDLITVLAKEHNTGCLTFDLNEGAVVRFADGKLVHAEHGQLVGEAALLATFRTVHAVGNVCFQYHTDLSATSDDDPHDPSLPGAGDASLAGPLQVLLLKVALELAHEPS